MSADKPTIAVLLPEKTRRQVLDGLSEQSLQRVGTVRWPEPGRTIDDRSLPSLLGDAEIAITGWGTPSLSSALLAQHPKLKFVAHTAGSIRRLVPLDTIGESIRLSHAAALIADAVAEFVVAEALLMLRRLHELDAGLRGDAAWLELREGTPSGLLGARTVGVIGAGYVGRAVIQLLKGFGCRVLVADPMLTVQRAVALGVESRELPALLAESDIVSLHAPVLPETRGMIGEAEFARLRDGALFINTARAALVDEPALLRELESGRISACIDVFGEEPLPGDSPFRRLPNALISPHAAGHSADTHKAQGHAMIEEVGRFIAGDALRFEVSRAMIDTMA
jgi:phosphoglycerate dehydrogenase-like enzyme